VNRKRKITLSVAAAILAFFTLSAEGCDKGLEPYQDAPIGKRVNKNVDIIEMPDGYSNIATVCKDGVRYSSITNGGNTYGGVSVTVDPACAGK
jgi:hypothetical protein